MTAEVDELFDEQEIAANETSEADEERPSPAEGQSAEEDSEPNKFDEPHPIEAYMTQQTLGMYYWGLSHIYSGKKKINLKPHEMILDILEEQVKDLKEKENIEDKEVQATVAT